MSDERSPMDLDHLRPLIQAVADARRLANAAYKTYDDAELMKSSSQDNLGRAESTLRRAVRQLCSARARADG